MKRLITISVLALLMATPVWASPATFGDGGVQLQTVLNNATSPYPGTSSVNVTTDAIADGADAYWAIGATNISGSNIVFNLNADFRGTNEFGIYDMSNSANRVAIFTGGADPGTKAALTIDSSGNVVVVNITDLTYNTGAFSGREFGYYLDSSANGAGGVWFSATTLNSDGMDHMYAYQGKGDTFEIDGAAGPWSSNEYVLAFGDLAQNGSDRNYTDMVVMVESVSPVVPAPAAILLGGIGVSLVGWLRRKRAL